MQACRRTMYLRFLIVMVLAMIMASSHAESSLTSSDQLEQKWQEFKIKFDKKYKDEAEEEKRKQIFKEHLDEIDAHNELYSNGLTSYSMGINQFADMEDFEYRATLTSFPIEDLANTSGAKMSSPPRIGLSTFSTIPKKLNWTSKGYVTHVKKQGTFKTCYAFAAIGALEGQHFKRTGKLVSLSEQQIVDCSPDFITGSWQSVVFKYIKKEGINSEKSYPYKGKKSKLCNHDPNALKAKCKNYKLYPKLTEDELRKVVATVGPVCVTINTSPRSFEGYKRGVYDEPRCNSSNLNHAVLLVGYGTDSKSKKDYWIVKNSWGKHWGMNGYIHMVRNKKNQCGIANSVSYPIV